MSCKCDVYAAYEVVFTADDSVYSGRQRTFKVTLPVLILNLFSVLSLVETTMYSNNNTAECTIAAMSAQSGVMYQSRVF
jgi:hypothetical protein